ncbi:hypothetical protein EP7_000887 [Isosphaeraceae bacterium EP7]
MTKIRSLAWVTLMGTTLATTGFAAERTVVVPQDTEPFTVTGSEIVRLAAKGIAGSRIEARVTGPAKVVAENSVSGRVGGRKPLGLHVREFEIEPTGPGRVKVTIVVKPPQPNAKPITAEHEFTVE